MKKIIFTGLLIGSLTVNFLVIRENQLLNSFYDEFSRQSEMMMIKQDNLIHILEEAAKQKTVLDSLVKKEILYIQAIENLDNDNELLTFFTDYNEQVLGGK
jgi:hypothetical protein